VSSQGYEGMFTAARPQAGTPHGPPSRGATDGCCACRWRDRGQRGQPPPWRPRRHDRVRRGRRTALQAYFDLRCIKA